MSLNIFWFLPTHGDGHYLGTAEGARAVDHGYLQQVAQAAMQLSPDERVDLAEKLWVSVDTPEAIAAAWDEEIARRVAQLEAGEVETVPAEQVISELRTQLA